MSRRKSGGKKGIVSPEQMQKVLTALYDKALDGVPAVSRSVDDLANDYARQYPNDNKAAAKALAHNQIVKCGTSGFVTSLGGITTLPIAISADMASVLYMQIRMIAAIAQLGGFDPNADQVQTLVLSCLAKEAVTDACKEAGIKIGQQVTIGAIKKIPGPVIAKINQRLGFQLLTRFGYSKLGANAIINISKVIPVVGGVVGGGFDVVITKAVAARAITLFIYKQVPTE